MPRIGVQRFHLVLCLFLPLSCLSCSPDHGASVADPITCHPSRSQSDVTVATYNIHSGIGRDGKRNLSRIVDVLRDVDVAGLQEVDNGRVRSGFDNQTKSLAAALGRQYWQHFPAEEYWPLGTYGNAAISSLPIVRSGAIDLPLAEGKPLRRLAWMKLLADCRPLYVFILHLTRVGNPPSSAQTAQADATWQAIVKTRSAGGEPAILLGDFNASMGSAAIQMFRERMIDVLDIRASQLSATTSLDHIFVTNGVSILDVEVRDSAGTDHPAIVARLQWK